MPAGRPKGITKTGGRKKGTPNKIKSESAVLKERTAEQVRAALENSITPLECLLAVMGGSTEYTERQIDAAKAAAPYIHARKVDHGEDRPANNTTVIIGGITDADRIEAVRQLLGKDRK
jgi:hypothetical protein